MRPTLCAVLLLFTACVPGAAQAPADGENESALGAATQTVFLNFGGTHIDRGDCSDARSNCSNLVSESQDFAPFSLTTDLDRGKTVAAVTQCVSEFFSDMDVRFVTDRPTRGDYTMMVIGANYPSQLGFPDDTGPYARSPVDCNNSNRNDIGFVLLQDDIAPDLYFMCRSTAHELGHTFGMVHTKGAAAYSTSRTDMMCETAECFDAVAHGKPWDTANATMETESTSCKGTDRQNTYGDLLETLGVVGH